MANNNSLIIKKLYPIKIIFYFIYNIKKTNNNFIKC